MKKALLAFVLLGFFASFAGAFEIQETLPVKNTFYLETAVFRIMVVTIVEVDDENATNAEPPTGRLRIEEVLRGKLKPGEYAYRMDLPVTHDDMVDPQNMNYDMTEEWKARPAIGPSVGETFIMIGAWDKYKSQVTLGPEAYKDTPENRAQILKRMGKKEILLAFLGVLLTPFFSIFLVWKGGRFGRHIALWLMPPASIGIWWLWEMRIPSHAAIRIDWLLILPAVGCVFLLSLLSAYLLIKKRKEG